MKKNSSVATSRKQIFKEKKLTIGMDLGDQSNGSRNMTGGSNKSPRNSTLRFRC